MGNDASTCNDHAGSGFLTCAFGDEATQRQKLVTEQFPSYMQDAAWENLSNCNIAPQDPTQQIVCVNPVTGQAWSNGHNYIGRHGNVYGQVVFNQNTWPDGLRDMNAMEWNGYHASKYDRVKQNIEKTCPTVDFDTIWPYFYKFSQSSRGQDELKQFFSEHPELTSNCRTALTQNYRDLPATSINDNPLGVLNVVDVNNPFPFTFLSFKDSLASNLPYYGNPVWTHGQQTTMFERILGTPVNSKTDFATQWAQAYIDIGFFDPGKSPGEYFNPVEHAGSKNPYNDPDYAGMLPYKPPFTVQGEPWHASTFDPKGYGYNPTCNDKSFLDTWMPIVGGGVSGVAVGMFIPGETARAVASISAASAAYYYIRGTIGWEAVQGWATGDNTDAKKKTSQILSVGLPITGIQILYDFGIVPEEFTTLSSHAIILLVGGFTGYYMLEPILEPTLKYSGDAFTIASLCFSTVEEGLHLLFNGCATHDITLHYQCNCEFANVKPLLADALLGDVMGVTEQQLVLRKEAMNAAMTSGSWGSDPYYMGACDSSGHMDNKTACISAGEWAYLNWPTDFNPEATNMYSEISHILDANNQSFLPPDASNGDDDCVTKYGKYFRNAKDGSGCKDFRAPKGMQGPGQYVWDAAPKPSDCVIA